uniref:CD209 antigen-like protein C n=1 Tax=Pogona vitticeps TaxID=103695 RepID=A0A6J0TXW3_9SAUR|nr:CD209 antigen-like protein C isoform X2 [Pogona vitticeps]XP_020650885.1 CD209 antigen-like protein C isoform X2 [Pogona vitticeps]
MQVVSGWKIITCFDCSETDPTSPPPPSAQLPDIQVADEVLQLPKHLAESEKAYGHRKAKYQTIFKKGKLSRSGDHWEVFGRSLFYISDIEKTWYDAENFCTSRDAHLTSILTDDEQFFLSTQLSEPTWIGLSDENVEGDWEWTDGSRVITQYWSRGVPTPLDDYSDCAFIDPSVDGLNWEHSDCHQLRRWVCKEKLDIDET